MNILLLQLASPNSKSGKSASLAGKRSCQEQNIENLIQDPLELLGWN